MSVALWAGENDLLWDYTEKAPSSSPDNGLYWNNKVNDAAGTNNGLKGIKLNSSGFCAFKKAAVAGKLKLSFGPRTGTKETYVEVWNCTWGEDGKTPAKGDTKIATTGKQTEYGTQIIELTAEQNDIYLWRGADNATETVLQKIEFKENVARTFVDFKIEFRDNPYKVLLPANGELPEGVLVENTNYNGGQHGIFGGTITVPVDGPVKFTIGACQYSGTPIVIKKDGEKLLDFSNNAACGETSGHFDQNVTYTYTGDAGTLTFELAGNTYVPYFFAEATEVTPCEIIFKDQKGAELGRVETIEGATLDEIPYTEADLPSIAETDKFRGWFYTNGKKAVIGDPINGNTTIQAKVTPVEYVTVGSVQTYDFASPIFYPEDHETVEVNGGSYYNEHGWYFSADGSIDVKVAGNAVVVVTLCKYSESGDVIVNAGDQELGKATIVKNETPDGTELSAKYSGEGTTLKIHWTAKQYIHKVVVYNVQNFVEKDETTGYIMVPAGDAASFIMALVQAQAGDKIFLPNGLYDLGETCLTTISKNNIAIIGQSMEGVIIKNAPDKKIESIDKTATIKINKNVAGTYLQDLTIQNALDFYNAGSAGRAVCLWDQGTKTVCKNVRLLSYQDTYYSNLQGAVKYFEDCEIHGNVDFICGDGSVYFKNNLLYCEKRYANGGGADAITANNGIASDRGYVFEGCIIKSECPTVSFGRAWNNKPTTTFLNTLVDYSAGEFSFVSEDGKIQRWTKELMNANAWPKFGEFNTHMADGTVLTPENNLVTFVDPKTGNATQTIETVLTAEEAATISIEHTLGDWAASAQNDAKQFDLTLYEITDGGIVALPEGATEKTLLVERNGEYVAIITSGEQLYQIENPTACTVRAANGRGGFGTPVQVKETLGIDNPAVSNSKTAKMIIDGQLIIVRDGKEYNMLGAEL